MFIISVKNKYQVVFKDDLIVENNDKLHFWNLIERSEIAEVDFIKKYNEI